MLALILLLINKPTINWYHCLLTHFVFSCHCCLLACVLAAYLLVMRIKLVSAHWWILHVSVKIVPIGGHCFILGSNAVQRFTLLFDNNPHEMTHLILLSLCSNLTAKLEKFMAKFAWASCEMLRFSSILQEGKWVSLKCLHNGNEWNLYVILIS